MLTEIKTLTENQLGFCKRTVGDNSVYALIAHHLASKTGASIVRMGDGEKLLLEAGRNRAKDIADRFDPSWMTRQACVNITYGELTERILRAGNDCTYFAPSVSGLHLDDYDLYGWFKRREFYLDNFFIYNWTHAQREKLVTAANGVIVIHAQANTATALRRAYKLPETPRFFCHAKWEDTQKVVDCVLTSTEQLVLFSAGPAGKWLAPAISAQSSKVVLDVGNAMPLWTQPFRRPCGSFSSWAVSRLRKLKAGLLSPLR